jgi:hypothetical protein
MKNWISFERAGKWLMISLAGLLAFHFLVLVGVVPPEIIWGGQLDSEDSLLAFEGIAISLTALFLGLVALRIGRFGSKADSRWVSVAIWLMTAYFLLNTLGNLASGVGAENFVFAPFSLLIALLSLRLAIE